MAETDSHYMNSAENQGISSLVFDPVISSQS